MSEQIEWVYKDGKFLVKEIIVLEWKELCFGWTGERFIFGSFMFLCDFHFIYVAIFWCYNQCSCYMFHFLLYVHLGALILKDETCERRTQSSKRFSFFLIVLIFLHKLRRLFFFYFIHFTVFKILFLISNERNRK